jgi:chromatin structure-remodeling complex subunit RSC1/2
VNQFSTPASLVPPRSPDARTKAQRARVIEADKAFIDTFEAGLDRWQGPEIHLAPAAKTGGIEGSGWFGQGAPEVEQHFGGPSSYPNRIRGVLHAITEYRDAVWVFPP